MSEASGLSYAVGSTVDGRPVLSAKLLPNRLTVWREDSFSQNPTVEQNVRPPSGKCQYVLASRLNSEAAQHPAVNQRASLCSALTKMYPSSKQPHPKTKTNSGCPGQGGRPAARRRVQVEGLPTSEVSHQTWWKRQRGSEGGRFPLKLKMLRQFRFLTC
ncbi:hypothetical protein KUCAC02_012744 [Chaenocephalus aceratus]|uniref:Uncharacterized protein n=1 Tax=Chaenocephalus aceratus TaxID=36190 RepID=A0ACB9XCN8_CHAAC|nr:hypothetical protein KUCAC02_012744 [Chaenocephalus aceratus]